MPRSGLNETADVCHAAVQGGSPASRPSHRYPCFAGVQTALPGACKQAAQSTRNTHRPRTLGDSAALETLYPNHKTRKTTQTLTLGDSAALEKLWLREWGAPAGRPPPSTMPARLAPEVEWGGPPPLRELGPEPAGGSADTGWRTVRSSTTALTCASCLLCSKTHWRRHGNCASLHRTIGDTTTHTHTHTPPPPRPHPTPSRRSGRTRVCAAAHERGDASVQPLAHGGHQGAGGEGAAQPNLVGLHGGSCMFVWISICISVYWYIY